MKTLRFMAMMVLCIALASGTATAQQNFKAGDNAALRYWAAFAQMQDSEITQEEAKEAHAILDGTAPYVDSRYKGLVEKNKPALETMARGAALPYCDWGVEMQMGDQAPVEYARKAALLGRLNVFYAFHLLLAHDKDGAVRTLQAGLRFSHDVANGGTLFATVVSKGLIVTHLKAMAGAVKLGDLSPAQRSALQKSVQQLGQDGLDWPSAMKRELELIHAPDAKGAAARDKITASYMRLFNNPGTLPELQQMITSAPQSISDVIPNPKRVLDAKQELTDQLQQVRSLLQ
jgi:hypothetical protein